MTEPCLNDSATACPDRAVPTRDLASDLERVMERTSGLWEPLRGGRVFLTGATGFIGRWMLETVLHANRELRLGATVVALSRDPAAFLGRAPRIAADPAVIWVRGDLTGCEPPAGGFSHVIHAAADFGAELRSRDPLRVSDSIAQGTRAVLALVARRGAADFLLLSSGAVYGACGEAVSEECVRAPDTCDAGSVYGEAKRYAEQLCALYARQHGVRAKIARCFALAGPFLPAGAGYAIADFIRDALAGGPIRVRGDGKARRSYLYAADMAVWLWHILLRGGVCRPYNVGSDRAVTMLELAREVAACGLKPAEVIVEGGLERSLGADCYVPVIDRARSELGLAPWTGLREAILKTAGVHT